MTEPAWSSRIGTSSKTLFRAVVSAAARAIVSFIVPFLLTPYMLRHMTMSEFGTWAGLASLLAIGILADAGLRTEVTRRVADGIGRSDIVSAARAATEGVVLLFALAMGALGLGIVAAGEVARLVFPGLDKTERQQVTLYIMIVSAVVAALLVTGGLFATLAGLQRQDYENYGTIAGVLTAGLVTVVATRSVSGIAAYVAGAVATVVVLSGFAVVGLYRTGLLRHLRPQFRDVIAAPSYMSLSLFVLVSQIGSVIDVQLDKILLSRYVGTSAAGQYQVGSSLPIQLRIFLLLPLGTLLAGLAELRHSQPEAGHRLFILSGRATMAVSGLVYVGLGSLAGPFIHLWLGRDYPQAQLAALGISIAAFIGVSSAPLYYLCISREWHGVVALSAAINSALNLGVSWLLTMRIGFTGALIGSVVGNAVASAVLYLIVRARYERRLPLGDFVKTVAAMVATSIVVGATYLAHRQPTILGLAAQMVLAILVYTAVTLATRLMKLSQFPVIWQVIRLAGREPRRN